MTTFTDGSFNYTIVTSGPSGTVSLTSYYSPILDANITIPATASDGTNSYTIVEIHDNAFSAKNHIISVTFTLPSSITSIGANAFLGCSSLTSIAVPDSVTSIGVSGFSVCTSLGSMTFDSPSSINTIDFQALWGCSSLTSITIPSSVTNIGDDVFTGCTSLTMSVDSGNTYYYVSDNVLYTKDDKQLLWYPPGRPYGPFIIPNTVTSVNNYAFYSCGNLNSITIPNSVNNIGKYAFIGCSNLSSIAIPNSVASIGKAAFSSCSFTSVTIPSSVNIIDIEAFYYCNSLTSLTFDSPSSVTSIGVGAFAQTGLFSVTIPSSVTNIGDGAFLSCTNLTSITCPTNPNYAASNNILYNIGYTQIECYAAGLPATAFSIPSSVTNIAAYAFGGCANLASVTIPSSVASIGSAAFQNCPYLTSVTFDAPAGQFLPEMYFDSFAQGTAYYYKNAIDFSNSQPANNSTFTSVGFASSQEIGSSSITCFKEDTKILTNKGYILIQDLRKGDLIKTSKNGYLPIDMIGKKEIHHPASRERIKDQLYKCAQEQYPEIFEDLIITGCHSILVDEFKNDEEKEKTIEINKIIYVTDRKYRLPACADNRASIYEHPGNYTIYHLALENDDYYMNYGIYANGLLVETCSKRYLKEISNMSIIID